MALQRQWMCRTPAAAAACWMAMATAARAGCWTNAGSVTGSPPPALCALWWTSRSAPAQHANHPVLVLPLQVLDCLTRSVIAAAAKAGRAVRMLLIHSALVQLTTRSCAASAHLVVVRATAQLLIRPVLCQEEQAKSLLPCHGCPSEPRQPGAKAGNLHQRHFPWSRCPRRPHTSLWGHTPLQPRWRAS